MQQLPRGSFLRMQGFFLKNLWHFNDIFREFEAFRSDLRLFFKDFDSFLGHFQRN
jgi:hypothetical protein